MIARRIGGELLTLAGAAGLTACVLLAFTGMRDVMQSGADGSCASGGPFVSVSQCSDGDMRLLMVGIMGGLVATAVYAAGTSALGRPVSMAGLLAWTGLFGTLGWNFISLGLHPGAHQAAMGGWLFTGGAFWLMALVGLVLFLLALGRDLRYSGRPVPAVTAMQPLVMAAVVRGPGQPGPVQPAGGSGWAGWPGGGPVGGGPGGAAVTDPLTRRRGLLRTGFWLVTSVAGVGAGLTLGGSLVTMLR